MKHEWRKKEKDIYLPKNEPVTLHIPAYKYITISGQGNPNSQEFSDKIAVLYPLSYAIKMMKNGDYQPDDYYDYTVYPLEGLWNLSEKPLQRTHLVKMN